MSLHKQLLIALAIGLLLGVVAMVLAGPAGAALAVALGDLP